MIFGMVDLPWWGYLVVLLCLTQITILSVTLFLHRSQAHRAITFHPIINHFFRFWLWFTTGMLTKEWTAIHRKHHAKVETTEDPHSPQTRGIKKVFLEGAELYREEAKNKDTLLIYGEGTPDDWIERNIYSRHSALGITLMLIINIMLFGIIGISMWAIQMAWIPFFAAGVVNGIGHYWGYRNFECKDASRNITPLGIFIGGEELHNNHHAYPTSAKFSMKWWEFDLGWGTIKVLEFFKLAKAKRIAPKLKVIPSKTEIDNETLSALISNRLQVLSRYTKCVMLPAFRYEKKHSEKDKRALLVNAKRLLIREETLMREAQKKKLSILLENFQSLSVVYQFRVKLQSIWSKSSASQKELIESIQEWCRQAEETGMDVLENFAHQLKTFVPQKALRA